MKIVCNRFIPRKGFLAVNLFGILFVRTYNAERVTAKVINHERIHTAQMKELGFLGFYILYFFEWLYRLMKDRKRAYRDISFEKEAYLNQSDMEYLSNRKHFAQWR